MNKVFVITGATSGIGKALTEVLAQENTVFAGYRSEEKLNELSSISNNIIPFYIDYSKPETISDAITYIKSKCKKIDTLINIAGCVVAGPIEKLNIKDIKKQFDVNVFGHLEIMQGLVDYLENGKIINISSMASFALFPFISPYCASKKCLDIFFNLFMIENKKNIKVISIKPGVIKTPLWEKSIKENKKLLSDYSDYKAEMEFIANNARKNEQKGLDVKKVVEIIQKIDKCKNPKLSYTIGTDAFFAHIISKLPQNIINKLVKLGLNLRMKINN